MLRFAFEYKDVVIVETKKSKLFSLKVKCSDDNIRAIHSLYDPDSEAKILLDSVNINDGSIVVVLGLGLGYHINELINRYPNIKRIFIVECSNEIFRIYQKYGVRFKTEKVEFNIGCNPNDVIRKITEYQIRMGMLPINVLPLPSVLSTSPEYYKLIYQKLINANSLKIKEKLSYAKFNKKELKICLLDFGYFLRKEIFDAIRLLGHKVFCLGSKKDDSPAKIIGELIKVIIDKKPDFILTVNHLGFDEDGILTDLLKSINMPVAVWYVDSPNIIVQPFRKNISENIVLFLWDWAYRDEMLKAGFKNIFYLPLATNEKIFRPIKLSKKAYKRYYNRIAFVGNSMVDAYKKQIKKITERYRSIVDELAIKLSNQRLSFTELINSQSDNIKRKLSELSEKEFRELEATVYWKATQIYRLRILNSISHFSPTIYGDNGWKYLLNSSYFKLKKEINYYDTLPLIYSSTEINLNATNLQMPTAVNQRVFDVPACGGFLLTDYQKALDDLFDVGKEVIVYNDIEELPELVEHYLKYPEQRKKIATAARKRVLSEHTYVHRLKEIIRVMKELFS